MRLTTTKDGLLAVKLAKTIADWYGVEPLDMQEVVNALVPPEEEDKPIRSFNPADYEVRACVQAVVDNFVSNDPRNMFISMTIAPILGVLIDSMAQVLYEEMKADGKWEQEHAYYLGMRRIHGEAWWVQRKPTPTEELAAALRKTRSEGKECDCDVCSSI